MAVAAASRLGQRFGRRVEGRVELGLGCELVWMTSPQRTRVEKGGGGGSGVSDGGGGVGSVAL